MRVFLAMLSHETNTFSNVPTDRVQFEARGLSYGGEIVEAYRGTGTCLGGMIGAAERLGMTLLPSVAATASPAGLVTRDIYQHVKQRMLTDLKAAGRLDGVLLDLHGAMVPEGVDDGEGDIIAAVRQAVGPDVPIAVTLDFHGNLGRDMIAGADLLHGYKTYPHVDMAERGVEAAERLAQVIAGRLKPTAAWRKPPLMPPLGRQGTARGPMRRLYDLADEMERDPKVISISLFAGFPYADIPDAGLGVYVVTDDDKALAERLADRLARVAWEHRHEFIHTALPVKDAVADGARRRGPAHRARRHGRQHRRRRGGRRHRDPARAAAGGRAQRDGGVHLGRGGGTGVREGGGRRVRDRSTWAARWTIGTARRCA